jgi:LmbE family N-acetylglucosaminyl deacetylase
MSSEVMARMGAKGIPPVWRSVLAVSAHPDDQSSGLGPVLDAFMVAGIKVEVICLTHGQAWRLPGAPGDLAALRGAEMASAVDVLGPVRAKMQDCPDGALGEVCQTKLANEVVAAADDFHPDGLLAFDTAEATGRVDHAAATAVALLAGQALGLPVLGWNFRDAVAKQLNEEFGASLTASQGEEVDMRVTVDRARRRLASHAHQRIAAQGSNRWRRLEVLAEMEGLRWLRPPGGRGRRATRAGDTAG